MPASQAISCPTTTLCVAVDNAAERPGRLHHRPDGPASAWTLTTIGSGVTLDSVSCASATFCMIGGTDGYYTTAPTGGASGWKATTALSSSYSVIASLACNTLKLCVGVGYGNAGVGLATGSSAPSTTTWSASLIGSDPPAQNAQVVDSVACPTRNFCVAVDGASNAYTSSTPVRGELERGQAAQAQLPVDGQPGRLQHRASASRSTTAARSPTARSRAPPPRPRRPRPAPRPPRRPVPRRPRRRVPRPPRPRRPVRPHRWPRAPDNCRHEVDRAEQ